MKHSWPSATKKYENGIQAGGFLLNPPAFKLEELFSGETLMALRATKKHENAI